MTLAARKVAELERMENGRRERGRTARARAIFLEGKKFCFGNYNGYGYKWLGTNIARVIAKLGAIIASSFGTFGNRGLSPNSR